MTTFLHLRLATALLCALLLAGPARAQTLTADWAVPCASGPAPYPWGPRSVAADAQGNTYVTGTFAGTITLGSTTLSATQTYPGNTMPSDGFLAKLNAQGQYQWAMQLGDAQSAQPGQVAVDNAGNVFLTGSFDSYSLQVGPNGPMLYNSSNNYEGFVARFSGQSGQCQWARRFGGTGADGGGPLLLNAAGEIYLTGRTGGATADFGAFTLAAATPNYASRGFLAKLNAAGTWLWAQQLGSNGQVNIAGLVLDGQENIYLSGSFTSPGVTLGTATLVTNVLTGWGYAPGADVVVAKYTKTGAFRWAIQGNASGTNYASAAGPPIYDGQGHLYVAGAYGRQAMSLGTFTLPNASIQAPQPNPLPPTPYTDNYYNDAFVARLDTAGTWQWATRRGGQYNDGCSGLVLGAGNRLLACYTTTNYAISSSVQQLVELAPATGNWGSAYPIYAVNDYLPAIGAASDPLGRLYLFGPFNTTSLTLGGLTVLGAGVNTTGFVARLGQLLLATQIATPVSLGLQVWPTPGPGTGVWVQGAPAGQAVDVLDMLGRRIGSGHLPASGPLQLSWPGAGLAPGVYIVRSGAQSCRWVVE